MDLATASDRYWTAYNAHDLEGVLALMDDDVTVRFPTTPQPIQGKEPLRKAWTRMFNDVIPDIRVEVVTTVIEGSNVACEHIERGTITLPPDVQELRGLSSPIRPYEMPMGGFKHFNARGLIVESRSYWDTGEMCRQLGIQIQDMHDLTKRAHT
jgi:steroid delta-isomerase-like uncharacterized protein